MNYAERIRALREDNDKTQTEIAQLLKVGQRTYCDYELGKTRIPVDSLIMLARLYDVSMDYICGVSDRRGCFSGDGRT
ncbi:MAG: helix-turn-helix transcriptional regulator [Oscillospiraceae bacterium]|nr:helix-turn-helix transcriptional regulator [Oscillospiraceae bacterium]